MWDNLLDALNTNSGAIIGVATIAYVAATLLMVTSLVGANGLTRQLLLNQARPRLRVMYDGKPPARLVITNVHIVPAYSVTAVVEGQVYFLGYLGWQDKAEAFIQAPDAGCAVRVVLRYEDDFRIVHKDEISIEV